MEEYFEELIFFKESSFGDKSYYIFQNATGEYRITESDKYSSFDLKQGMTLQARMIKKGCAGREITELIINCSELIDDKVL